jgi:hypothetical protein
VAPGTRDPPRGAGGGRLDTSLPWPGAMLELRPNCELCDKDLPPGASDARICSYECTFCAACVEDVLNDVCPNCGGGFQARPVRPAQACPRARASSTTRRVSDDATRATRPRRSPPSAPSCEASLPESGSSGR